MQNKTFNIPFFNFCAFRTISHVCVVQRFKNNPVSYVSKSGNDNFHETTSILKERVYAKHRVDFVKNCTVHIRRMPVTYKKAWLSQQLEASASRNNCRRQRRQPSRSKSAPKPWGLDIRSKPRRSPIRDNAFFPRRLPPRVNFASIVLEARAAPEGKKVAARSPLQSRTSWIRPVIGNYATTTSGGHADLRFKCISNKMAVCIGVSKSSRSK